MKRAQRILALGLVLATAFVVTKVTHSQAPFAQSITQTPDGDWRITWSSVDGEDYIIQRSQDGETWSDVETVRANDAQTAYVDTTAPAGMQLLWRVVGLGPGSGEIEISDLIPTFGGGGGGGTSTPLAVSVGEDVPVESVVFFDGETPLGTARPGPGGLYQFSLDWDPAAPRVVELSVEVTPTEGDPVQSDPVALLVADPSRFVPIALDGSPQFGNFILVDGSGALGAFAYYPEGFDDPDRSTGAHIAFSAGSMLVDGTNQIDTSSAEFFRGAADSAPVSSKPGVRRVDLGQITPGSIDEDFELPSGELTLQWGAAEVAWQGGELGPDGWAALQVAPILGGFELPSQLLNAQVGFDEASGELFLLICFHGDWSPAAGGVTFRIPAADPLKFYLGAESGVRANGTVEALFPDGATLRGSASWRDPVFEISLEGRGFTIPAAGKLNEIAPTAFGESFTIGATDAELDEAAERLAARRGVYRSIAVSSLKEAAADGAGDPSPLPTTGADPAGSVLEGWAWRLRGWEAENPGETMDEDAKGTLALAVAGAGATAEAARSPATPLKLLRDVLMIQGNREPALAAGDLVAVLADADARCSAAAERLLDSSIGLPPAEVEEIAGLFEQINEVLATGAFRTRVRRDGEPTTAQRITALAEKSAGKVDPEVFRKRGILPGVTDGTTNTDLAVLTAKELLLFLDEVRDVFRLQVTAEPAFSLESESDYPLEEALLQVGAPFSTKHDIAVNEALGSADFRKILGVLRDRERYFEIHHELGRPLASDDERFEVATVPLLHVALAALANRLPNLDPAKIAGEYFDLAFVVAGIGARADDNAVRAFYGEALSPLARQNERLRRAVEGSGFCDPTRDELLLRGFDLPSITSGAAGAEGDGTVPFNGFYESTGSGTATTMQISRGGRYFTGWLQYHGGGFTTDRDRLRGELVSSSPGSLRFAYFRIDESDDTIIGAGELEAVFSNGVVTLTTTEQSPLIAGGEVVSAYVQTSRSAPHAKATSGSFPGEIGLVFDALQHAPLHSTQMRKVVDRVNAPASQGGLIAEIDRHFNGQAAVSNIDASVADILDEVSSEQRPLARLLVRQILSSQFGGAGAGSESYWEKLVTARATEPAQSSHITTLLGLPPNVDSAGNELFLYHFRVDHREIALPLEIKNVISSGIHLVEVKVDKFLSSQAPVNMDTVPIDSFTYTASLGQIGFGVDMASLIEGKKLLQGLPDSGTIIPPDSVASVDEFSCRSNYDYVAEDLEGGFYIVSANAGAAFGLGQEIESTAIIFGADGGNKPPLVTDPGNQSDLVGWRLPSAGLDFSFGALLLKHRIDNANEVGNVGPLLITRDLFEIETEGQGSAEGAVDFRSGSAVLLECGWQNLRELAAEHRALFDSPTAEIEVVGTTDTVPISNEQFSDNAALSLGRANSVKNALVAILGWPPGDPRIANIEPVGLGEAPARNVGELGDNTDDPAWRQVEITINDVVKLRIAAPSTR